MRRIIKSRGSILIWTLLLGISLATVFFFFSQRLGANVASQRETIQYQNARLFLESYANYLQGLSAAELAPLRDADEGNISFEGVTGTLTNEVETITGVLDAGGTITYSANIPANPTNKIQLEWDKCPKSDTEILEVDGVIPNHSTDGCLGLLYEKGLNIVNNSFTLSAPAGPTAYQMKAIGEDTVLYDNEWQLELELSLSFRKKIAVRLAFTPDT